MTCFIHVDVWCSTSNKCIRDKISQKDIIQQYIILFHHGYISLLSLRHGMGGGGGGGDAVK